MGWGRMGNQGEDLNPGMEKEEEKEDLCPFWGWL